ncbi:unnamed protein product [Candidula unifasciata]|uniref:C-type lectin domain-containing protein n=1 Tax=Candidula unifasciata TaxID=100452 RepID=A0A8S3YE87_9EUPU|nr:unnamed protein product [Candidula unifasciata]
MLRVVLFLALTSPQSVLAFCNDGWLPYHNVCVVFSGVERPWHQALAICTKYGGWIYHDNDEDDPDKHTWIVGHMKAHKVASVWIGGFKAGYKSFEWMPGFEYIRDPRWAPGQPKSGELRCISLQGQLGYKWKNENCTSKFHYICERRSNSYFANSSPIKIYDFTPYTG